MGPVTEAEAALWCSLSRPTPTPLRSVWERSCAFGGVAGAVFEPYGSWWAAGPPTRLGASWWLADPRIRGNAGNFLRGLVGRGRVLAKVWLAVGSSIRLKKWFQNYPIWWLPMIVLLTKMTKDEVCTTWGEHQTIDQSNCTLPEIGRFVLHHINLSPMPI